MTVDVEGVVGVVGVVRIIRIANNGELRQLPGVVVPNYLIFTRLGPVHI